MKGPQHSARISCRKIATLLATVLLVGCSDETSAGKADPLQGDHDSDARVHSETNLVPPVSDQELLIERAEMLVGEWDFDPDALRKTSEYQQQIKLIESSGYTHEEALKRGESAFGLMSSIKYEFTSDTITIHTPNGVISQTFHVLSQEANTVVIQPEKSELAATHTTIRIIDHDHIVVSDDSRPDVPVWTFKRSSNQAGL